MKTTCPIILRITYNSQRKCKLIHYGELVVKLLKGRFPFETNPCYVQGDWTLRFKNHKVTVLLLVDPGKPFESIKETLLQALNVRNIKEINGQPVPEDPSEIEFGVPIDRNNLDKGWQTLDVPHQANGTQKRSAGGKKSVLNTSPQGAGLKDSQAVAFRFHKPSEVDGDEDEIIAAIDLDDPGWDVQIPKDEEE